MDGAPGGAAYPIGHDRRPEDRSSRWVQAFSEAVVRWRMWVLLVSLAACIAAATGLLHLTFNPDSRIFLGSDSPQRQALERIEHSYTAANTVEFVVVPKNGTVFDRRILELLKTLTEAGWNTPHAFRASSLANHQDLRVDGDEILVEALFDDPATLSDNELAQIRNVALAGNRSVGRNVSQDGSVASVTVLVQTPDTDAREAIIDIAAYARALTERMETEFPEAEIRLTGGIMGDITFAEAARQDTLTLIPLMAVVIAVTLLIGLRTVAGMFATLAVVGLSALVAMGIGGYLGFIINAATAGAPVIIMTLAIADSVHLLTTISYRRRQGYGAERATISALRMNFAPIAITSVTTAIGFMTLNFSESPPLRELGTIVAIGSVAAWILSITFLPAAVSLLPNIEIRPISNNAARMRRLADFAIARRHWLLAVFVIVVPVVGSGIARIEIDDNYVEYFDESFAFRRDTDFMENHLTGFHVLQFSLPSGESQGVARPDYLEKMDAFATWLEDQEQVSNVHAITKSLKQVNRTMNGDDPRFERLPETREMAAQYLIFLELALPPGFDLGTSTNVDRSEALVSARLLKATSSDVRELAAAGEQWLQHNAPDIMTEAAGVSVAYAYITERNIKAMLRGTVFCLLLLSAILLIYLGSMRIGLISLIPNLVPALMAFGLWGYFRGDVNLAVSVVGAMTLGIVVVDTVHFLSKYSHARRDMHLSPRDAIRHTFVLVGPALIMTSATLFLGFVVLAMSGFAVSSQAGLMSAITIAIALVADLLFLPALLLRFGGKKT